MNIVETSDIVNFALVATAGAAGFVPLAFPSVRARLTLWRHRTASPAGALPAGSSIFVRNPAASTSHSDGETLLIFPGEREGLALNPVATRCWDLMNGARTLTQIATILAAENHVSQTTAFDEIARFAQRLSSGWLALPAADWDHAHTHFSDLFTGVREEGITEIRCGATMTVHIATAAIGHDGERIALPARSLREARAAFARHITSEARQHDATRLFDSGWEHCQASRLDEAARTFEDAARVSPGWAAPHYQLGYVHLRAGRYKEAVEAFGRTERMSPAYFMVREYLDLATKLAEGSLAIEAFHLFERAASAETADPEAVIDLCARALALSPDFPTARLVLGRAYARKRDYERALRELQRAIGADADRSTLCNALYARGSIFMARGMPEKAVREFEMVIEINGSPGATRSAMANLASSPSVH